MEIRMLLPEGIEQFRAYLHRVRSGIPEAPPFELLEDSAVSSPLPNAAGSIQIEQIIFTSKLEAARYLVPLMRHLPLSILRHEIGLWSWLSLFYIDQLAPASPQGLRKLLTDDLYIPSVHYQRRYRNLLLGPFLLYLLHGDSARLLLTKSLNVWSDLEEQLWGVQEIIQIPGGLQAADILYYNDETGQPKLGVTNRNKGGTVRRLREVLQQLDVTFDIYSLKGSELVSLLPSEFDRFKPTDPRPAGAV